MVAWFTSGYCSKGMAAAAAVQVGGAVGGLGCCPGRWNASVGFCGKSAGVWGARRQALPSLTCVEEWLPQMITFLISVTCVSVRSASCAGGRGMGDGLSWPLLGSRLRKPCVPVRTRLAQRAVVVQACEAGDIFPGDGRRVLRKDERVGVGRVGHDHHLRRRIGASGEVLDRWTSGPKLQQPHKRCFE
jgi:hypothetical protein